MKKIGKAELKNATVLNESEMKNVVGGNGPDYCMVFCKGSEIVKTQTCRGAAYQCGNEGYSWCSGSAERCYSDFSGSLDNKDEMREYHFMSW